MRKIISLISALLIITMMFSSCSFLMPDNGQQDDNQQGNQPEEDQHNYVDVIIFMGQSNMAGRGDASLAVPCGEGHAYEFKAVTDPTKLYPLVEPFGQLENNVGLSDISGKEYKKTGGPVSAFCEAYYQATKTPVVAVSASQGGTNSSEWQPGYALLGEAKNRLELCLNYMYSQDEFEVRNVFMVWLQGEGDAGNGMQYEEYNANMRNIVDEMKTVGVQHCYVISIGTYMKSLNPTRYDLYIAFGEMQAEMCANNNDMTHVSRKLAGMPESMMHLNNHYLQEAYNIMGNDAGKNTAYHVLTGKAPVCEPYVEGETVSPAK